MKKTISIILSILLLALAGCGTAKEQGVTAETSSAPLAAGRYIESEIDLPLPEGVANQQILGAYAEAGTLIVFTCTFIEDASGGHVQYYRHTVSGDGSVSTTDEAWLNELAPMGGNEMRVQKAEDGALYMSFSDYDEKNRSQAHLIVSRDGGATGAEMTSESLKRFGILTSFGILADGGVAAGSFYDGALLLLDANGNPAKELDTGGRIGCCAAAGGTVAFTVPGKGFVRVYRTADGTSADYSFSFAEDDMPQLAVGADGAVFLADKTGLYRHAVDGTIWEKLVDGATAAIGLPNFYASVLTLAEDGAYPVLYVSDLKRLLCYRYDAAAVAVADKEITVFSLKANDTVRQAIVAFNRTRGDVKVTYAVAMEGSTGGTEQDYIKALNTELLAGTGPDVLILDGLPIDSYIEKDVLLDLTATVAGAEQALDNIIAAYAKDGKLCAVPTGFMAPVAYAAGATEAMFTSVSALADAAESAGTVPLLSPCAFSYRMLARYLIRYYGESLKTGSAQDVQSFLTNAKRLAAAIGSTEQMGEGWDALKDMPQDDLYEWFSDYIASPQVFANASGLASGGITHPIGSFGSSMETFAAAEKLGANVVSVNGLFLPVSVTGVNKASKEQEAACAFVQTMLSAEVNGGDQFSNQFPVNAAAFDKAVAEENAGTSSGLILNDGAEFNAVWPKPGQRARYAEIVKSLTTPILDDAALMDMLLPAVTACIDGSSTVAQAAETIESLMRTYLAE